VLDIAKITQASECRLGKRRREKVQQLIPLFSLCAICAQREQVKTHQGD